QSDPLEDRLFIAGVEPIVWRDKRIATRHTHGTGCTLSSAIATCLGMGLALPDAVGKAREFVRAAIENAPGFGSGHGPMGHHAVRL
ncbi:MAG: hydroxymethylpyrimidine/phosphomethylpyrimidine kinase, partial [Novosphingobium sp.]|nr:hydroxymethylpyrimidine/phosphomethylpyrimidine kinase [Novosphingobium sp.]